MDVLRENIGLLILEGADHSKLLKKIEAKYGLNINPSQYGVNVDRNDTNDESYKKNRILARLLMLHRKNQEGISKAPMFGYVNDELRKLRIERFWDQGKVKLQDPSFDVTDRKNTTRNFNLARAQQAASSAGTTREKTPDGTKITTTTYDPIHNKTTTHITYEKEKNNVSPQVKPSQPHINSKIKYGLGGLGALGLGAGLYTLRKRYQNKNKSFLKRLFNR